MPAAVPFIAAAFSVTEGLAAIAAGSELLGGLMVAGGGLSAVGALTGNKDLTNLGAVLGFAGGVGSLINKASTAAAEIAPALADTQPATTAAAGAGASTTVNTGGNVVQGADAASQAAGISNDVSQTLANSSSNGVLNDAMNGYSPGTPGSLSRDYSLTAEGIGGYSSASPAQDALGNAGTTDAMRGGFGSGSVGTNAPDSFGADRMTATQLDLRNGTYDAPPQSALSSRWDQIKQFGKDTGDFMKKYPELTKFGGGVVGGAMDYFGKQQLAEDNMKRVMAYDDWQRQRYSDSVRNLRVPGLVRTAPQTGGIIAGARG